MVGVGKAAAGPAKVRDPEFLERLDHVVADPPGIGDLRVPLPHIISSVDAPPEVLGEVPVDVPADRVLRQIGVNDNPVLARSRGREENQEDRQSITEGPAETSNQKSHLSFLVR